jgi:hypothetical protein
VSRIQNLFLSPDGSCLAFEVSKQRLTVHIDRFFAQLVNGGGADRSGALDEWVRIEHQSNGKNIYWMRQNLGGGNFAEHVQFDVDMDCNSGPSMCLSIPHTTDFNHTSDR